MAAVAGLPVKTRYALTTTANLPVGSVVTMSDGSYWIVGHRENTQTVEIHRPPWWQRLRWAIADTVDRIFNDD